jgi:hypothetical protein
VVQASCAAQGGLAAGIGGVVALSGCRAIHSQRSPRC